MKIIQERKIDVIKDLNGKDIVIINDVFFKGKQRINWHEIESYLKQFVGKQVIIKDTGDLVYIGTSFPDEYVNSNYSHSLKGAIAKAKANAAQGIPEIIQIANKKRHFDNLKEKHENDATNGWYRYDTRFALPVYNMENRITHFNIYSAELLVMADKNNNLKIYDILRIAKIKK